MGISVGSQALARVVNDLFADLKGNFVFSYLDDLVVFFPRSVQEHSEQLRVVLRRLREASFTVSPDKVVIAAEEIKYLGHVLSSRGISVLPDRVAAIKPYPAPPIREVSGDLSG